MTWTSFNGLKVTKHQPGFPERVYQVKSVLSCIIQIANRAMSSRTLTLQRDFHKSLGTPKVSSQDWYYSKKLLTNLLGIYCAYDDTINCFLYDKTTGGVGPNEAILLLDYLWTDLESRLGGHDQLIIWCDNSLTHFKECYLFFYMDDLVKKGKFLRPI